MDICLPIFILYLLSWWFQTPCWWIQTALKVSSIPFPSFCLACLAWASRLATSFSSSVISPFTTTRSASAANMDRSMRAKKLSGSGASEAWRGHQGLHGREAVKTWRSVKDSQGLTKSWNCILKAGEPFRESSLSAWGAALAHFLLLHQFAFNQFQPHRLILNTGLNIQIYCYTHLNYVM